MKLNLNNQERDIIRCLLECQFDCWDSANFETEEKSNKLRLVYTKLYDKVV